MNVFILDSDPELAAVHLCDVHRRAALREYGQILSGALALRGEPWTGLPRWQGQRADGLPNRNRFHVWAAEEPGALRWLAMTWRWAHFLEGDTHPRAAASEWHANDIASRTALSEPLVPARFVLCERGRALAGTAAPVPLSVAVSVYREIIREKAAAWAEAGRRMTFGPMAQRPAWMGVAA